jgi:TPR repeat protein
MDNQVNDPRWDAASNAYEAGKWDEALSLFKTMAGDGIRAVYVPIARIYEYGYNGKWGRNRGVEQNLTEAIEWYTKAHEAGYVAGPVGLARIYLGIYGSYRDYEKCFYYLSLAKRYHSAEVYYNLGTLYHTGKGVKQDKRKAKLMYLRSVAKGNKSALTHIGSILAESGHPIRGYWLMLLGIFQVIVKVARRAWEAGQSGKRRRARAKPTARGCS